MDGLNPLTETRGSPVAVVRPDAVQRPFRAVIFDWDGTAVIDRREDGEPLVTVCEPLLRCGVWLAVVTGTNFGNIDRQFCQGVAPGLRRRLLVCANRGSEAFGFSSRGDVGRRYARAATAEEDRVLTAIAERLRAQLTEATGLDVRIIYDRLNRRKVDLIPVPEWADPPKSRIGDLLAAVEARLSGTGWQGGLAAVVDLTRRLAGDCGLPDARITSDVKHVEIGLTDKSDALTWLRQRLLVRRKIALGDVLIAGDEFGPIAGFPGSDDLLCRGIDEATVVSVGPEPNGVPDGVLHLGGGPPRFRSILADQVSRHNRASARHGRRTAAVAGGQAVLWRALFGDPPSDAERIWQLTAPGCDPAVEHEVESHFALGNGRLGVRGALDQPIAGSQPRTFLAGLFAPSPGQPAIPALVPLPDWTTLTLAVDGHLVGAERAGRRVLNMLNGTLFSEWQFVGPGGEAVFLRTLRFVSLAQRSLAAQVIQVEADRPIAMALELTRSEAAPALVPVGGGDVRIWRADSRGPAAAMAETARSLPDPKEERPADERCGTQSHWRWLALPGATASFQRVVAVARNDRPDEAGAAARAALDAARRSGSERLLARHRRAWAARWADSDVEVDGDAVAQTALRFAAYHLISAANPEDDRVSVGARALTGDAYLGHVFWDTEIFLLPFYTFTWPAAARALLLYRFHTLPAARAKAKSLRYRGALYAWESAGSGDEATPPYAVAPDGEVVPIRCGTQEHHISADVAYAVWQYWQATADQAFLLEAGAEIILETARFWASRSRLEADGRYHIRGVIGPDEYHEGVDDNAFTNGMARWNLQRAVELTRLLAGRWPDRWEALRRKIALPAAEVDEWTAVAINMALNARPEDGLIEQFAGFFGLEQVDLADFTPRSAPMDVVLGSERTHRSQIGKQADVVMLLALLPDSFSQHTTETNFRYYEARCGHGSSLSPAVHALVAARLGDLALAERYFRKTAAIDLDDTAGSAAQGIHIAALGGLWQVAVFGFAGLMLRNDGLKFVPRLPSSWEALRFHVRWRGRRCSVALTANPLTISIRLEHGRPLRVYVGGLLHRAARGSAWVCRLRHDGAWEEVSG